MSFDALILLDVMKDLLYREEQNAFDALILLDVMKDLLYKEEQNAI